MNEQLQEWLLATLEKLTVAVGQAADFASGELPLFVKEFLFFHACWSWGLVSIGLIVCLVVLAFTPTYFRTTKHWDTDDKVLLYLAWALPAGGLGVLLTLINLYFALMVTFAPRVYLLTEFIKFFRAH